MNGNTIPAPKIVKGTVHSNTRFWGCAMLRGRRWVSRGVGVGENRKTTSRLFIVCCSVPHPVVTYGCQSKSTKYSKLLSVNLKVYILYYLW